MLIALLVTTGMLSLAQTPGPYELGIEALSKKDAAAAVNHFQRCLNIDNNQTECHWELGWAYWLLGDWGEVVQHWERVQRADPNQEGLAEHLSQARDNLGLEEMLAVGRSHAPPSFASDVPEGTTLSVRAVGDMMIGTDFPAGHLPPNGGRDIFADLSDWLSQADLTFGNLEGPLCDGGSTTKCGPDATPGSCYAFRSPGEYAQVYQTAGFDMVSTANNHAGDFGEYCRLQTETLLDEVNIAHSGRPGDIAKLDVNGLKIAMVGFHTSRSCHYINDHDTATALVRALASEHDIVIVSFHGGAEGRAAIHVPYGTETFFGENRGDLRTFSHAVVDAGADLVLGHGPHVLRGMELYKDRLIAYSLGNFATYGRFNLSGNSGLGVILEVNMDPAGGFISGQLFPTRQIGQGIPTKDTQGRAIDLIRTLSHQDFPEYGIQVAQDGTIAP